MTILTPLKGDGLNELVDWLELRTLHDATRTARLDEIGDALDIGDDEQSTIIAKDDEVLEDLYVQLAGEVKRRYEALGPNAYPFSMSQNGEAPLRAPCVHFGHFAYLVMLVISHSWKDGKLLPPLRLETGESSNARSIFEVISAVAAVAYAAGPSFLVGSNREGAQGLLDRIGAICAFVGEGSARGQMHPDAPVDANDDGVDLVAVDREVDLRPPARRFIFGQSASGANFKDKPIRNLIDAWLELWFDQRPTNPVEGVIFVPTVLEDSDAKYYSRRLGHVLHRIRIGHYAAAGADMVAGNAQLLHFVDAVDGPQVWLRTYAARTGATL